MASGILHSGLSFVPGHLFIFQLFTSSAVVGLTAPASPIRPLALPVVAASTYGIVKTAVKHLRPRWASLLGGLSFGFLLRYLDVACLTRWDYRSQGPTANSKPTKPADMTSKDLAHEKPERRNASTSVSLWSRLLWGWNTMWSFRQINTPYEVRNTPAFSASDPAYVPSKWTFVAQKILSTAVSYIILDLLAQRPPPKNAAALFNPSLIPFFRRLGEVTWPQAKLRTISIVIFGVTFYCVIQGAYPFAAALSVATGLSDVSSWRPPFGALSEAYSLRNFWGKVWHQNLRRLVGAPASYLIHDILGLDRRSALATATTTLLSFAVSGIMHLAAGHSSGMPLSEMGVVQFFCTQAFGIILETTVVQLIRRKKGGDQEKPGTAAAPPSLQRVLGYFWVLAFLAWSGPSWLYPQAARQGSQASSSSFVPYSVVQAWKVR